MGDAEDGFPIVAGSFDTTHNGGSDMFVAKLDGAGTALVSSGFISGSSSDDGQGIAVDAAGAVYAVGSTGSAQTTFPDGDPNFDDTHPNLEAGFDPTFNSGTNDAFSAKVNPSDASLDYVRCIGGDGFIVKIAGGGATVLLNVLVSPTAQGTLSAAISVATTGDSNLANNSAIVSTLLVATSTTTTTLVPSFEDDKERKQQPTRNDDDERIEGDVIEVRADQDSPVEVRLIGDAKKVISSFKAGDYLEGDGFKEHEGLFYADEVEIRKR